MSLDKVKKRLKHGLEGNIQSRLKFFIFYFLILDKFILKTWISRRVSYFVGILSRVRNIFLLNYPQVLSLLNVGFRGIFKPHKT